MKQTLISFPEKIETQRLYIRPPQPGDGEKVQQAIAASLNELKPWLPFAHAVPSLEDAEDSVRRALAEFIKRDDIRLHIFRKEDNEFIGSTGFHRINWKIPKVEIGYWLDTRYTKKGYMVETVNALVNFAFQEWDVKRIEIRCDPRNNSSRTVAERAGFTLEGILRNDSLSADESEVRDTCVFAITQ
ncbi:MAG TPA: GNAT family N-acetyltransferase [Bacillus sp. (in: firmicutes)]|uniref:GNAT family N-acetyltransferase n=1 Tax=Bacillus litorisediminis TaxID=2922713 RepID=UPI001FAC5D56|nr:GNAT family N-acetyltransferase [Bacillus litorisediminis]HWO75790.1 GNAT family N-acetyltransferase [Bacillus sp. (in: firmicutes)]